MITDRFGDSPKVRHTLNRLLIWPEYTRAALAELEKLAPPDITLVERLRDEVRLAVIVANGRGLFRGGISGRTCAAGQMDSACRPVAGAQG